MIGSEEPIILINSVEHGYLRKKFGVVYIRRHKVQKQIVVERTFARINKRLFNEVYLSLYHQDNSEM